MRSLRRHLVVTVALVLALSGCTFNGIYDLPLPGNNVSKDESFLVKADFADVLNVVPRTAVMVADVPVGQVESVTRVGWHARLTIRIRNDVDAAGQRGGRDSPDQPARREVRRPAAASRGRKELGRRRRARGDLAPTT